MAVTVAPYCTTSDLFVGESVMLPETLDLDHEIASAADEMDAFLGFVYVLPFVGLPDYQVKLLKSINMKIASGRILLQLYGDGEGTVLHAYGLRLLSEGQDLLMKLANGEVDLAAERVVATTLDAVRGPAVKNADEESAVDIFEAVVMRGQDGYWNPGKVM